jgi:hypothetical protein
MNDGDNPNGIAVYFIDQMVAAMRCEFTDARHFALVAQHQEVGELGDNLAYQAVDPGGGILITCARGG